MRRLPRRTELGLVLAGKLASIAAGLCVAIMTFIARMMHFMIFRLVAEERVALFAFNGTEPSKRQGTSLAV